jgi:hypothetical protein
VRHSARQLAFQRDLPGHRLMQAHVWLPLPGGSDWEAVVIASGNTEE